MKRLLFFLLLAASAFGQGAFIPPQTAFKVVNGFTSPIANATITVCPASAAGIPCAPVTVSIFKDVALTQPLANPFTADSQGNYQFAAALANTYTVTVTATGFNGYSYQVTLPTSIANGQPVNGAATPGVGLPTRILELECDSQGFATPGTGGSPTLVGTQTYAAPTSTETQGCNELSAATASTNVVVAVAHNGGTGSNGGFLMFATTPRWTERVSFVTLTNARYWTGLTDGNSPTDWSNATFATDTPARFFCMFRYSSTTDTTIKAVCSNATTQTVTDTGITPVAGTSILFEIQPNSAMTSVAFFINGSSVATITTNLPSATNRFATVWLADNKNTATQVGGVFFWSQTFYSK